MQKSRVLVYRGKTFATLRRRDIRAVVHNVEMRNGTLHGEIDYYGKMRPCYISDGIWVAFI